MGENSERNGIKRKACEPEVIDLTDETTELSDEECERALKAFAKITGTDEACAHFFLQDVKWKLQAALDRFFSYSEENFTTSHSNTNCQDSSVKKSRSTLNSPAESSKQVEKTDERDSFTVMSWNIDGLDKNNLKTRFTAVCFIISNISPDVVFIQEMSPELTADLRSNLGGEYSILLSTPSQLYFTAVLLKPAIELKSHSSIPFTETGMGRSMQIVEAAEGPLQLRLINTHLESTKEHSETRKVQLCECFKKVREWDNNSGLTIIGGDLNIRDNEISDIPKGFSDAWIAAGSDPKSKFTWDTRLNNNRYAFGARFRFDRVFWNSCGNFSDVRFSLEGRNRIRSCLCFPSDHWAVVATFRRA